MTEELVSVNLFQGKTRDWLKIFKERRNKNKEEREKELERVKSRLKLLDYKLANDSSKNPWRKSWRSSGIINPQEFEVNSTATNCACCKKSFSMFGRKKKQCMMCEKIVCNECCSNIYQLSKPVEFCNDCFTTVNKNTKFESFRKATSSIEKHPFIVCHKLISATQKAITEDVSKLKHLLDEIGDEHTKENELDVKFCKEQCSAIQGLFKKHEEAFKVLLSIEPKFPREQKLHGSLKTSRALFLQDYLPIFKILSKQVDIIASQPIKLQATKKTSKSVENVVKLPSVQISPQILPNINLVNPAVIPVKSTSKIKINISGENFMKGIKVMIDKNHVDCEFVDSTELIVDAPLLNKGFKTIKVVNPDGGSSELEDILFYSEDLQMDLTDQKVKPNNTTIKTFLSAPTNSKQSSWGSNDLGNMSSSLFSENTSDEFDFDSVDSVAAKSPFVPTHSKQSSWGSNDLGNESSSAFSQNTSALSPPLTQNTNPMPLPSKNLSSLPLPQTTSANSQNINPKSLPSQNLPSLPLSQTPSSSSRNKRLVWGKKVED